MERWAIHWKLSALLALAALLSGCANHVFSEKPWFPIAPAGERSIVRDGIWRGDDPDCKVVEADPVERWPDCAGWAYVRGSQLLIPGYVHRGESKSAPPKFEHWEIRDFSLVAGDPPIFQATDCIIGKEAEASGELTYIDPRGSGPVPHHDKESSTIPPAAVPDKHVCYGAVRSLSFDDHGLITSLEYWDVLCGLPEERSNLTGHPWPSVTMAGPNCTVASQADLRDAARRSRTVAKEGNARLHWVRDGYR